MTWMRMNIPLMVMFFALWVGIPLWLVLRHPDRKPTLAAAPGDNAPARAGPHGRRLPPRRLAYARPSPRAWL